ncbi:uncharacterized protein BJ171DRAFT_462527 [Polychytrium aggregatum]|uniref:uncharacterized protein n=1 Tax=Polychytrium aggregatum TaxID=110093 RepID=UPI0022FEAF9C|nr:uncharacterized protein BJ171DRAFT_462527 [Polychytrium aggregatum]KAI9199397.1 hypothetical protein BJ171DRAFT_462527 [Polychytrium aggregatum]
MVLALFRRRSVRWEHRRIFVNMKPPPELLTSYGEPLLVFPDNSVRTSKYTVWTFLPMNILEQFHRVKREQFFLMIIVLQFLPEFQSTFPLLSAVPLAIILSLNGIKDGVEDYRRHQADRQLNHSVVLTLSDWNNTNMPSTVHIEDPANDPSRRRLSKVPLPGWRLTYWSDLHVGDLIYIRNNEAIPADTIILSTSEEGGSCYIETKNLDGETNLKARAALPATQHLSTADDCRNVKMSIDSESPQMNLYSYHGSIAFESDPTDSYPSEPVPVGIQNLLLRGSTLRSTDYAIGVVVYTGNDTKVMLNSGSTPFKRSQIERLMNYLVLINFCMLAVICLTNFAGAYIFSTNWINEHAPWIAFDQSAIETAFFTLIASIMLYQNIVPISLYVTLEVIKSAQALFIYFDDDMYYSVSDERCIPKSWTLSDDLGQIEYVFSDKTGTLTQNKMEFRQCLIGDRVYGMQFEKPEERHQALEKMKAQMTGIYANPYFTADITFVDQDMFRDYQDNPQRRSEIERFFLVLALCHTVVSPKDEHVLEYEAQSPDEFALVTTARNCGFIFVSRNQSIVKLNVLGSIRLYEIMCILEFNSDRKRMSVITKDENGILTLICKGADNVILPRLSRNQDAAVTTTNEVLHEFAQKGLRTLCLAQRQIPPEEYQTWLTLFEAACRDLNDREAKIDELAEQIEVDLELIGTTAIEDRLQDGVMTCIEHLRKASIHVWVLTGDKLETAINVGFASKVLDADMTLIILNAMTAQDLHRQIRDSESLIQAEAPLSAASFALVVDGGTLKIVMEAEKTKEEFVQISLSCKSVICCRVSPKQKAEVVQLIKHRLSVMCLAIGDGANDVSMIQAADVGVGISGQEGSQAAMSSDYVIAQFRFLTKLLLSQGHMSYYRISGGILMFFFKSFTWVMVLMWYQILCGFTANIIFDYTFILLYNIIFTSLGPIVIGVFDSHLNQDSLMAFPEIYIIGMRKKLFTYGKFFSGFGWAIYQSLVCAYLPLYVYQDTANGNSDVSEGEIGLLAAVAVIISVNITMSLSMRQLNAIGTLCMALSTISPILYMMIWCEFNMSTFYGIDYVIYTGPRLWAGLLLCVAAATLPLFTCDFYTKFFRPGDVEILREMHVSPQPGNSLHEYRPSSKDITLQPKEPDSGNIAYLETPMASHIRADSVGDSVGSSKPRSFKFDIFSNKRDIHRVHSSRSNVMVMPTNRCVSHTGFAFSVEEPESGRASIVQAMSTLGRVRTQYASKDVIKSSVSGLGSIEQAPDGVPRRLAMDNDEGYAKRRWTAPSHGVHHESTHLGTSPLGSSLLGEGAAPPPDTQAANNTAQRSTLGRCTDMSAANQSALSFLCEDRLP